MSEPRKIGEVKSPSGVIPVFENGDVEQMFVDGVYNLALSPSIVKLDFYQSRLVPVADGDGGKVVDSAVTRVGPDLPEERTVMLRMAIPTKALVEFCVTTLKMLSQNKDVLVLAADNDKSGLLAMLHSVKVDEK